MKKDVGPAFGSIFCFYKSFPLFLYTVYELKGFWSGNTWRPSKWKSMQISSSCCFIPLSVADYLLVLERNASVIDDGVERWHGADVESKAELSFWYHTHKLSHGWTEKKQMHFIEADLEDACPRASGGKWRSWVFILLQDQCVFISEIIWEWVSGSPVSFRLDVGVK